MNPTRKQVSDLAAMGRQMKTMAAEMNAAAAGCKVPAAELEQLPPAAKSRPAQLQINQTGGWRSALDFDAGEVPEEFLQAADQMARLSGKRVGMRIVFCIPSGSGSVMPTRNVLMHWTRETGWALA